MGTPPRNAFPAGPIISISTGYRFVRSGAVRVGQRSLSVLQRPVSFASRRTDFTGSAPSPSSWMRPAPVFRLTTDVSAGAFYETTENRRFVNKSRWGRSLGPNKHYLITVNCSFSGVFTVCRSRAKMCTFNNYGWRDAIFRVVVIAKSQEGSVTHAHKRKLYFGVSVIVCRADSISSTLLVVGFELWS